ncbi:hypothetical protein BC831DRAFT_396686 [Entophlyctis helioformis]|nr:hypothetical protein BC831DRAFT_396686 [Entophlyctis helioformis]
MSSGFGTNGGRGRCFPFWQEFTRCHVQADAASQCSTLLEDYQECLYHRKEVRFSRSSSPSWLCLGRRPCLPAPA